MCSTEAVTEKSGSSWESATKPEIFLRLPHHQDYTVLSPDCSDEEEEAIDLIGDLLHSADDKRPAESFLGPGNNLSTFDTRYYRTLARYTLITCN